MSINEKNGFVAYEYKSINVKREDAAFYEDCLRSFGWEVVDSYEHSFTAAALSANPYTNVATEIRQPAETDVITLRFKRNSRLDNRQKLNALQRQCEEAITAIERLQRKDSAQTMGTSLGLGILGAGFITLSIWSFASSNIPLGIIFAAVGTAGCGIGFLASIKIAGKNKIQTEPLIQQQHDAIHSICEQATALLA